MARLFHGDELWSEIQRAARKSKTLAAAIAFVGKNPLNVIRWPKNTRLVTALSEDRVRRGATSAKGVKKLMSSSVEVRSHASLHAKVFVFDQVAFVGSANVSESSMNLEEAAVLLTVKSDVDQARRFVNELWRVAAPVDDLWLKNLISMEPERLISDEHQRARATTGGTRARRFLPFERARDVWLGAVVQEEESRTLQQVRQRIAQRFERDEEVDSGDKVEWTSLTRSTYRTVPEQDLIFVWWEPTKRFPRGRIEGPLRCLGAIDLGPRAGEDRYSRAEYGVRDKRLIVDAAALKAISSMVPRARRHDSSLEHAAHLHERLCSEDVRLKPADVPTFANMVRRLSKARKS